MKIRFVADTNLTRSMGLMNQKPLEKNECAYFYFERQGRHSFWNKNVDFPISLVFCNASGEVKDIKYLEAHQISGVSPSSYDIVHVVEAHRDAPEQFGIKKGSKLIVKNREIVFED